MDDEPRHGEAPVEDAEAPAPEDTPGEPGAEGGAHEGGLPLPFAPDSDDDSAFGDTDQHSDA